MSEFPQSTVSDASPQPGVLRMIDANANRAAEGLRVVEDLLRFYWEDPFLTRQFKQLRHDLAAVLAKTAAARIRCRSTSTDLGTAIQVPSESHRGNLEEVVIANTRRTAEGLRALAEVINLTDGSVAAHLDQLRYRLYTLEKGVLLLASSRERFAGKWIYLLMDLQRDDWAKRVEQLRDAGIGVIQLRDKQVDDRTLIQGARQIKQLLAGSDTLLIVNDRPDIARCVGAHGVHLGQSEMRVAEARQVVGPEILIGVSTHSLSQAEQAVLDGADYLGVGPMFPSTTKAFPNWPGPDLASQIAQHIGLPWFAIGGIGPNNIQRLRESGATRFAIQSALWNAADPVEIVRQLRQRVERPLPTSIQRSDPSCEIE